MRSLNKLLKEKYRIIEFYSKRSQFKPHFDTLQNWLFISKEDYLPGRQKLFYSTINKNSADILILSSSGWDEIKRIQDNSHALYILIKISPFNIPALVYFLGKILVRRRKNYNGFHYYRSGVTTSIFISLKRTQPRKKQTRHYLSPVVGLEKFFRELNKQNISYTVLRWFENLPVIEEGEDVDMLVKDEQLGKVHGLIDKYPGTIPFDIYSVTGIPGSDYKHVPYYSYSLATKSLSNSVIYKDLFNVPTWENYFYLLAYHVVFHKGERSGIKNKYVNYDGEPEHDYIYHLKNIALRANLKIEKISLENLHRRLDQEDYSPPQDTQYKLSLHNNYLKEYLAEHNSDSELSEKFRGLVSFIVRDKIVKANLVDELKKYIHKEGFTIIAEKKVEGQAKKNVVQKVRGGNWNQGPWPSNGGLPEIVIAAIDLYPIEPDKEDKRAHPGITNKRIMNKKEIRDFINKKFEEERDWCNGIHSSDNELQAIEYLSLAGFDKNNLYDLLQNKQREFKTDQKVIKTLSRYSKRAKVELISYNNETAVRKTFKPNCERFLNNEIRAYKEFYPLGITPKLYEYGENYLITEAIENARPFGRKIGIRDVKKCLAYLKLIYDKGYSLLDFQPCNFVLDENDNLYLIDFEFLYEYKKRPVYLNSYDLVGIPKSLDPSITPNHHIPPGEFAFTALWYRFTGLIYEDLKKLDDFSTFLKSNLRFYKLKIRGRILRKLESAKNILKAIHSKLP